MRHRYFLRVLVGALCALLLVGCSSADSGGRTSADTSVSASSAPAWAKGFGTVAEASLPAEARQTLRLIDAGGPFPYAKDGANFGNYERILPRHKRGYYREYTVRTPRERDRGARRIVTGRGGEFFYTDDHYDTFKAVLR
ncbi:ribonuclease N [Streptomyces sp. YC504]|uniref:Ribonuclease N n=1 Tax=Streptomyces mesophilus TaxID=1775132 RepID=A0A6G4XM13_9ACTN|nr:ribonuclease domain-containing protein [Streptomyces mesophilus]NGO78619.1 ribonuclease N [Streptomyces mesophilus]